MPRYTIKRSLSLEVSSARAIETVSDFGTWQIWSPWLLVDPQANVTVSTPSDEVGSTYQWKGEVCGEGELTQLEAQRGERVRCELKFYEPMKSICETEFTAISTAVDQCELVWTMRGKLPWFLFWMRGMLETFVGMDYERGLRMLKEYVETGNVSSRLEIIGVEQQPERTLIGMRAGASMDEVGDRMPETQKQVDKILPDAKEQGDSAAFYHATSDIRKRWFDYTIGYLSDDNQLSETTGLHVETIPAGRYYIVRHIGCYAHLANAWMGGVQLIRSQKHKMAKAGGYEIYRNPGHDVDDKQRITDVYIAIK